MSEQNTIPEWQPKQDTTAPDDWWNRLKELEKSQPQPCPTCHTCPTCGRKTPGQFFPPYPGIPYYPAQPGYFTNSVGYSDNQ